MGRYAVSDIHGCPKTFSALLDRLAFTLTDQLYLLGDYVDRGPDSKGVVDAVIRLQGLGYRVSCLRGNHENLVLRAQYDTRGLENWMATEGLETARSFGVEDIRRIPPYYLDWMDALPYYFEIDEYILVHAGLSFERDDPFSSIWDLVTIRYWHDQIRYDWLGDRFIIHGHTPTPRHEIEETCANLLQKRYLDIDAGCVYGGKSWIQRAGKGFGHLCAFNLDTREVVFQEYVD